MNLLEIASKRKATKNFNDKKLISKEDLNYIFKVINTAPTSMGLEQWRVISLRDKKIKKELLDNFGVNKNKFFDSSDALLFITKSKNWFKPGNKIIQEKVDRMFDSIDNEFNIKTSTNEKTKLEHYIYSGDHGNNNHDLTEWSKRQAYIASSYAMLSSMEKGINSTPVEGFDSKTNEKLRELNLINENESLSIVVLLGYIDGVEHPTHGKKQLRDKVENKFKIV